MLVAAAMLLQLNLKAVCKEQSTISMLVLVHKTTSDKGKPGESRRRKAMDLPSHNDQDRQAAKDHKHFCVYLA